MEDKIISRREGISIYKKVSLHTNYLKTKYKILSDVLSYPSIISIVARPQWGKTLFKDQLCMDLYYKNKDNQDVSVAIKGWVDFQLEMPIHEKIKRELMFRGININDNKDIMKCEMLPDENWSTICDIRSVSELEYFSMMEKDRTGKNMISIDHALILTKGGTEMQMLFETLVNLKKNNIYVIVLSQLRRDVVSDERCRSNTNRSKIYESDIYNSDILMQYSDVVIYIDRPDLRNISLYSSAQIPFRENEALVGLLKNRFGPLRHYKYTISPKLIFENEEEIDFSKRRKGNNDLPENNGFHEEEINGIRGMYDNFDVDF